VLRDDGSHVEGHKKVVPGLGEAVALRVGLVTLQQAEDGRVGFNIDGLTAHRVDIVEGLLVLKIQLKDQKLAASSPDEWPKLISVKREMLEIEFQDSAG
jgi:hypothetical protein